jgi:hypothetical protein
MVESMRETLVFQAEQFFTPEERQQFSAWLSSMAFRDRCQLLDELVEMNRTVLVWVAPFDADDLIDDLVSGYAAQLDHLAAA